MATKANKKFKEKMIRTFFLSVILVVVSYIVYKVVGLIAVPSDLVVIEDGVISQEESAIRICN